MGKWTHPSEPAGSILTTPIGFPDIYIITLFAKMAIDPFMEIIWMVYGVKPNKDMVVYLETMKERGIKRTRVLFEQGRATDTDQPY